LTPPESPLFERSSARALPFPDSSLHVSAPKPNDMYFLRRLRPLEVAGERVRSLRVSLNAPVLSTPDLPVGPARAVIVVHREPRGRMDTTVGARSIVSGQIAYWSFDGDLLSDADLSVAADAALTFAESLGFLFDEAPLAGGAGAGKAFRSWLEGEETAVAVAREIRPADLDDSADLLFVNEAPELALEELMVDEAPALDATPPRRPPIAAAIPPAASTGGVRPPRLAAEPLSPVLTGLPHPPQRTLSKFRPREAAPTAPAASPAPAPFPAPAAPPVASQRKAPLRQPLARVQLVKRRSPEDERKLVIRRLITSF
jgi:hypothetical protein